MSITPFINRVIHGDCLEVMRGMPDKSVDLVLTDPPYGIFKRLNHDGIMFGKPTIYGQDKSAPSWDSRPSIEHFSEMLRVSKQYVIWGGNYFADILGECKGPLVWNKLTGKNSYADGEIAWDNLSGTTRIFTHQWCGAFKDSERGQRAIHPTQKPVQLMSWCISLADDPDLILDPFCGSGTTLVAAKMLGRRYIGIEIEERYVKIAEERLRNTTPPLPFTVEKQEQMLLK